MPTYHSIRSDETGRITTRQGRHGAVIAASAHCEQTGERTEISYTTCEGHSAVLGHCVRVADKYDISGFRVVWIWQTPAPTAPTPTDNLPLFEG